MIWELRKKGKNEMGLTDILDSDYQFISQSLQNVGWRSIYSLICFQKKIKSFDNKTYCEHYIM